MAGPVPLGNRRVPAGLFPAGILPPLLPSISVRLSFIIVLFCLLGLTRALSAEGVSDQAGELSPFGIGGDHHTSQTPEKWMPQMAAIGIRYNRGVQTKWDLVEPAEGQWNWKDVDREMQCMTDNHVESGVVLIGNPAWSDKGLPGKLRLPVNNLAGWSNYVTEMAKHLKGKVKYWEVWNEPPNGIGKDQTAADYAKIVVAAYDAVKAVDPNCLVGMEAKSVHVNWLEQTIQAGAKDHFDYIILHPYEVLGAVMDHPGTEAIYMNMVPTVRKMLAAQDPAKVNVPIVFTEIGFDAGRGADLQGEALVKAYTMGIAQGVSCINWFEGMDGDSGPMGLLDAKGSPRPAYTAMAQMIKYLGPHPICRGWLMLHDKAYGFVFQGTTGNVLIAWPPKGSSEDIDFGQSVTLIDPLTGTTAEAATCHLTAPILVQGVGTSLVTLAEGNATKPFPWDGDYTNAKAVSVTYGETNVEKGLHTQSAASIAADVVAYGGSARSGSVPGGNVFMVDPNFLNYRTTPIEISVVVRRDAANDNAGFKLKYESTSGFKISGGWYTVPDNQEWHTVKYKITDAEFNSMWAFNFSLDSDGNQNNKYDIQSVTVTKLDQ